MYRKELSARLNSFLSKNKADQVAILFSVYLFTLFVIGVIKYSFFLSALPTLLFLAVLTIFRSQIFTVKFWLLVTFLLLYGIVENWHQVSNHQYVTVYLALALIFAYIQPENKRERYFKRQSIFIFALVLFFAGVQKLMTPGYTDGIILELMFLTGRVATFIFDQPFAYATEIAANKKVIADFGTSFIPDQTARMAWYSPFFHSIAKPLSWIIIIAEIAMGILSFWFFQKRIFQIAVVIFAAGVFIVTPEGGFLSLLLILSWSQLPEKETSIHRLYIFSLLLILSLLITRIAAP